MRSEADVNCALTEVLYDEIESLKEESDEEIKSKKLRLLTDLLKAKNDYLKTIYDNSFDLVKLESDEELAREKMEHETQIETLKAQYAERLKTLEANIEKPSWKQLFLQWGFRGAELAIPVILFLIGLNFEKEGTLVSPEMKALMNKMRIWR